MKRETMEFLLVLVIAAFVVAAPILTIVKLEAMCGFVRCINQFLYGILSPIKSAIVSFWKWFWLM